MSHHAHRGIAGKIAAAFLDSPLTPLVIVGSIVLGAAAVFLLPREEEPQIIVPMVDVGVEMPGATAVEVEQRVTRPMEKLLWEIPGVEYLYSTSSAGRSMVIVRFLVGEDETQALVRLNQKLQSNFDKIPPGATPPMVRLRSIDDVPVLALTLSSDRYDDFQLRQVAAQMQDSIKEVPGVSEVTLIGGRPREVSIAIDPSRLNSYGLDPLQVADAVRGANVRFRGSPIQAGTTSTIVDAGRWIRDAKDLADLPLNNAGVHLSDVARVTDGDAPADSYVTFVSRDSGARPAVTIAVAKRKGTNAVTIGAAVEHKVDLLRGTVLPADVKVTVTRNNGETAAQKSNELLFHMLLAVLSVSALIWFALGRRESSVVLIAIPVTLALTLFTFYLYGYTLNRITLFALIFSIGILVDDAIVVVENVVRHARLHPTTDRATFASIAVRAVDEVGNPTVLATLTVIAAILPMAFVGGLMGPYMRPIPVGASAAMVFSLLVAFIVTPWAAVRLLRRRGAHHDETEDRLTDLYRRAMGALIGKPKVRVLFLGGVAVLLVAAIALVPLGIVMVKMLPFDNKSEFQMVVNMPEGSSLEDTARLASALADVTLRDPDVVNVTTYSGTSAPYTFNGLVRHYFLRRAPNQGELQITLKPKEDRKAQSHAIAQRVREAVLPLAKAAGARIQVVEVPPGPPVLQTLVAEVYGPDASSRLELATKVRQLLENKRGVVDVDWYVEHPQPRVTLEVDEERAAAAGVPAQAVAGLVRLATAGQELGLLHDERSREDVPIVARLPQESRAGFVPLQSLRINGRHPVAVGEITREVQGEEPPSLYHKNLMPVTYVTADVAGAIESPVYAILGLNPSLEQLKGPDGRPIELYSARLPDDSSAYAMKWDGEWHITYEVFRDLGLAFAAVLILIYLLVVGWFRSFITPITIMTVIPFSLIGILPAHALLGAFFTATSMIGFIAGAGIVVRNSIILVDFIELRVSEGLPLEQAVIDAGAVRFRPIALTAAAVVVGAGVILFDPIFQGLAVSLMAGEVASVLLSPVTVPVLYYLMARRQAAAAVATV
jgi:multidrug efflux pump subunit AcrB